MATTKRSLTIFAMLFSVLVFASACGSSNDPQSWAEAEEDGNLRPNFIRACTEANTDGADIDFTDDEIAVYCECAFVEIVEYFGGEIDGSNRLVDVADAVVGRDFEAFKDLESSLRDNPEDIPADIRAMLTGQGGCTDQALNS
ncbi:MAG: hypothetical protein AAF081_14705 [Actinomycetota bacterium]